jgi:hypothetical protein
LFFFRKFFFLIFFQFFLDFHFSFCTGRRVSAQSNLTLSPLKSVLKPLDRPMTGAAGLIGSSLMGAAAVMGGAMDSLMSGNGINSSQEQTRRSSTPSSSGNTSGFGGIFNLKSVISAATKSSTNSSGSLSMPPPPVAPEPINVDMQPPPTPATPPHRSVQGTVWGSRRLELLLFGFGFVRPFVLVFFFCLCFSMKYCFN